MMKQFFADMRGPRVQIALCVGLSGWLVSLVMVSHGGTMARHLPDVGFYTAAFVGAFLAGLITAGGLGRTGRRGWCVAGLCFVAATTIGAALGSSVGMMLVLRLDTDMQWPGLSEYLSGLPMLFSFGWLAVLDGLSTSLYVAAAWIAVLAVVQYAALHIRMKSTLTQSTQPF
jgi:hypothetical protein